MINRNLAIGIISAIMMMGMAFSSYASEITGIKINVTDQYLEDTVLEPVLESRISSYEINSISWSKDVETWTPGKKVTCTLELSMTDGNTFGNLKTSSSSAGNETVTSVQRIDDTTAKFVFSYVPKVQLGQSSSVGWSDANKTKASWKKVKYADEYQLKLYNAGDELVKSLTVTGNTVDLLSYMSTESDYYYTVRAVGKDSAARKYLMDGEYVTSEEVTVSELGNLGGKWREYQEGRKYQKDDGNYMTMGWNMIGGIWYYFNTDGYVQTEWQMLDGKWYYLGTDGAMVVDWFQSNGIWYRTAPDGSMITGWTEGKPGKWYYMNPDGSMAVNTVIDGYQIGADGLMIH